MVASLCVKLSSRFRIGDLYDAEGNIATVPRFFKIASV